MRRRLLRMCRLCGPTWGGSMRGGHAWRGRREMGWAPEGVLNQQEGRRLPLGMA